jgi:hypothetical protein
MDTLSQYENMENKACGSMKGVDKRKAVALWTKQSEGVDGKGSKHRGMLRKCVATQGKKWQQKQLKTHNRKTLNVYHGLMTGTQGVKQNKKKKSKKSLPSMFENEVFLLVV